MVFGDAVSRLQTLILCGFEPCFKVYNFVSFHRVKKSAFVKPSLKYVGHLISAEGINRFHDKEKVTNMASTPAAPAQLRLLIPRGCKLLSEVSSESVGYPPSTSQATTEECALGRVCRPPKIIQKGEVYAFYKQ